MASFEIISRLVNKIKDDIPAINAALKALAKWDFTGFTDVPDGAIRATFDANDGMKLEKFASGTGNWTEIKKLMHDVDKVDGRHASTSASKDAIAVRNADGKLPGDILGNAVTAGEAAKLSAGTIVPVSQGGTGATTSPGARGNLGIILGTAPGSFCEGDDPRLSDARKPTAHSHAAGDISGVVAKTGDTMTGDLKFKKGIRINTPLDIRENTASGSGDALLITCGGATLIGGGEFPQAYYANEGMPPNTEQLYLGSDGAVHIISNYNTPENAKHLALTAAGTFYPINGDCHLGGPLNPWQDCHFKNVTISEKLIGPQGTTSAPGLLQLATNADVHEGKDATRPITSAQRLLRSAAGIVDYNTLVDTGLFSCNATGSTNKPFEAASILYVFRSGVYITQFAIPTVISIHGLAYRNSRDSGATWTDWAVMSLSSKSAPLPQAAAGVGQWVHLGVGNNSGSLTLPSGGTWAYFASRGVSETQKMWSCAYTTSGVAAGGTKIFDFNWGAAALCWRIA